MNIVLGISGGIAAYETPDLVRRLSERDADLQIVMTASAEEFVTSTALQAVSGRPIRSNLWDKEWVLVHKRLGSNTVSQISTYDGVSLTVRRLVVRILILYTFV